MIAQAARTVSISGLAPDRHPSILKPRACEECQDQTIAAHPFFDAVCFQVLVVHSPSRIPQQRYLSAAHTFRDCCDVLTRTVL